MFRIDRRLRHVAVAIVSALLIACGSDDATAPRRDTPPDEPPPVDTTPTSTPSVVGTWTSVRIYGQPMPARIAGATEPDGLVWEVRVLQDTLVMTGDGHWVQRVRTLQTQSDGFNFPGLWGDRGTWTRQGDVVHFESEWIENVAFDARLAADGTLLVDHNFTLDDNLPAMRREMKR